MSKDKKVTKKSVSSQIFKNKYSKAKRQADREENDHVQEEPSDSKTASNETAATEGDTVFADPSKQISVNSENNEQASKDNAQADMPEQVSISEEEPVKNGSDSSDHFKEKVERRRKISKEEYDEARGVLSGQKRVETILFILSWIVTLGVATTITGYLLYEDRYGYHTFSYTHKSNIYFFFIFLIIGILTLALFSLICKFSIYIQFSKYNRIVEIYEIENIQEEVEENLFESSLKMSYKYLDQYYAQTKDQANKGFFITSGVTIAGAFLLFIGIICMFIEKTYASKITIASGVIVEFISAIMFYLYNRTVQSMGNYHDKLFLSQNVAMALKISDSLSDDKRDDIKSQIVKELITDVNSYIVASDDKKNDNEKIKES